MALAIVQADSFSSIPVKLWEGGVLNRSWEHPASQDLDEAGDTIQFFDLPKGAKMLDALMQLGVAAASTLVVEAEITDGTTTKTFIEGSVIAVLGGIARPSKIATDEDAIGFVIPTDGWRAQIRVSTAATTPASAAHYLAISYTMDLEKGDQP